MAPQTAGPFVLSDLCRTTHRTNAFSPSPTSPGCDFIGNVARLGLDVIFPAFPHPVRGRRTASWLFSWRHLSLLTVR